MPQDDSWEIVTSSDAEGAPVLSAEGADTSKDTPMDSPATCKLVAKIEKLRKSTPQLVSWVVAYNVIVQFVWRFKLCVKHHFRVQCIRRIKYVARIPLLQQVVKSVGDKPSYSILQFIILISLPALFYWHFQSMELSTSVELRVAMRELAQLKTEMRGFHLEHEKLELQYKNLRETVDRKQPTRVSDEKMAYPHYMTRWFEANRTWAPQNALNRSPPKLRVSWESFATKMLPCDTSLKAKLDQQQENFEQWKMEQQEAERKMNLLVRRLHAQSNNIDMKMNHWLRRLDLKIAKMESRIETRAKWTMGTTWNGTWKWELADSLRVVQNRSDNRDWKELELMMRALGSLPTMQNALGNLPTMQNASLPEVSRRNPKPKEEPEAKNPHILASLPKPEQGPKLVNWIANKWKPQLKKNQWKQTFGKTASPKQQNTVEKTQTTKVGKKTSKGEMSILWKKFYQSNMRKQLD